MSRYPLLPLLAAGAIALSACGAKSAGKSDAAFDAKVHAYLIAHPEVVQEALTALQAKQDAADAAVAKLAINKQRAAIEHDARDFVANPNGKITVTEFYDYRCPHCINAAPAVLELIQKNPDVRFVFKEFPIFGETSDLAAQGAVAVKRAGGDYLAVYRELMATKASPPPNWRRPTTRPPSPPRSPTSATWPSASASRAPPPSSSATPWCRAR